MQLEVKPYQVLIANALKAREQNKDDFERDSVRNEARYVVRMCEAILNLITERGGNATLDLVMRAERCASGHSDYERKCAL